MTGTTPTFGTSALDQVRGPGTFNFDGGLFRDFSIKEHWKVEFRAEVMNLTNTPHFANPGANVSNMDVTGGVVRTNGFAEITGVTQHG